MRKKLLLFISSLVLILGLTTGSIFNNLTIEEDPVEPGIGSIELSLEEDPGDSGIGSITIDSDPGDGEIG